MKKCFILFNFMLFINTISYQYYFIYSKNITHTNVFNKKIYKNKFPSLKFVYSKTIVTNLSLIRKKKKNSYIQLRLINDEFKLKKLREILKKKNSKSDNFFKIKCNNNVTDNDNVSQIDILGSVIKKGEANTLTACKFESEENQAKSKELIKGEQNEKIIECVKKKHKENENIKEITKNVGNKNKEHENKINQLLSHISKNEKRKENRNLHDIENEDFDFLKYFHCHNNSLISELHPDESKEFINSNYFKKLMVELNLKEDEILNMLKNSEKNVSHLINKNLTLEEIEKKAKNEDAESEKLFDSFMNNKNSEIENSINFKKIGKKYKDIIIEAIILFLSRKKNFNRMIKNIQNINELYNYSLILKEGILFKDLDIETLIEITKKSILLGYLNQKFSNDIQNFEWNRNFENFILLHINNKNIKVKEVIYSNNSINIIIKVMKHIDMDSIEYDDVEDSIRGSIEKYEKGNNLDILSFFNIFISFI